MHAAVQVGCVAAARLTEVVECSPRAVYNWCPHTACVEAARVHDTAEPTLKRSIFRKHSSKNRYSRIPCSVNTEEFSENTAKTIAGCPPVAFIEAGRLHEVVENSFAVIAQAEG